MGRTADGTVADSEIEQDRQWLLWDNERRSGQFKLGASTRSTIKSYIDRKNQHHDVEWFLIVAPNFSNSAENRAIELEMEAGVDVRSVRADDFQRIANIREGKIRLRRP